MYTITLIENKKKINKKYFRRTLICIRFNEFLKHEFMYCEEICWFESFDIIIFPILSEYFN